MKTALWVRKARRYLGLQFQLWTLSGMYFSWTDLDEIRYDTPDNLKVYVAASNGAFQTVRHHNWRWLNFLWMTHPMDYDTRFDFNTTLLRSFSLMGLVTVLSGFILGYMSFPTIHGGRRIKTKAVSIQ